MTPVLYDKAETQFNHMGIGALADTISAHVTEERNGLFELEFVYPVDGPLFDSIEKDCIVKAKANDDANMNPQLFRIYYISKPINGQVDFKAEHVSYELGKNPITSINVTSNAQAMLNAILSHTVFTHRFTAVSDDTTVLSSSLARVPARSAIGGTTGSLLDVWGGELTFDNWLIRHSLHRGTDTGIIVAYGKNLTDVTQEEAIDQTYTSIYPYANIQDASGNQTTIELPEKHIDSPYVGNFAYGRCQPVDLSGDDVTDVASLRTKAQAYVTQNDFGKPTVSLTIKFIQLWQTEEYKNIAPLEHINLCDWVTVRFKKLGIDVKAEVIKTDFEVLLEKYISVDLGDAKSNLADDINDVQTNLNTVSVTAQKALIQSGQAIVNVDGTITFYTETEPTGDIKAGSVWFKKVNGQLVSLYRYNGISWDPIVSKDANDALNAADAAQQTADGKNKVWRQAAEPTSGMSVNDQWFRENADGTETLFKYDGTQWVDPIDSGVKAAQDAANTAKTAASNAQASADTAVTVASNALSIGSAAQTTADNAASAASDAQNAANAAQTAAESAMSQALAANDAALAAQTSADGKSTISYGTSAPGNPKNGDTWFKDNGNGTTTIQQYVNGSWTAPTDAAARSAQDAANAAQTAANNAASAASAAQTTANSASSAASAAQTTANGRNRILRQSTTPTGTFVTGDTWFDTANGNRVSVWNGSSWQLSQFGNAAVANLDAGAITTGTLAANRIAAGSIDVSKLVAGTLTSASGVFGTMDASVINTGTLNAARIGAGSIDATKIQAGAITATNEIIASIDASKITVGTLSSDRIGAQSIMANQIAIGDFSNLAPDPDFEKGGNGWSKMGTVDTLQVPHSGTKALHMTGNGAINDTTQTYGIHCQGGDQFYAEVWVKAMNSASSGTVMIATTLTGSGMSTTWPAFASISPSSLSDGYWHKISGTVTIPSGYTGIQLRLSLRNDIASGDYYFDDIQFRRMNAGNLIVDGAITASKIAASSIDASKIITGTLTSASGVFGSVDASILTTGTLNAARIAAKSIDASKLVAGTLTSASGVFGTMDASVINAGTLNAARIGAGTIDASKLVAGTITAASGVISSIDAGKITTGTLDTNRIAAGSIAANKLDVADLSVISQDAGSITAGTFTGVSVNASTFTGGTYTGGKFIAYGLGDSSQNDTVEIGNTPSGTNAPIHVYDPSDSNKVINIMGWGIGLGPNNLAQFIHNGLDAGDLSEENNVNIRTWQGFSVSPSIDGAIVQKWHPAFSVNARTGDTKCVGSFEADAGYIYCDHYETLSAGVRMVLQSDGEVYFNNRNATAFQSIRISGYNIQSIEEVKQDIELMTDSALDIVNNMDIYKFRLKNEVANGINHIKYGVVIGDGYRTPNEILSYDQQCVDGYSEPHIAFKAIQELFKIHQEDQARIADLETKLSKLEAA